MFAPCFQPNFCYSYFWYVIGYWKNILQKSKRPQTHLLMSFYSIRIMIAYIFISPKMNLWSDWGCFLPVSSQIFVIFTLNILKVNEKLFFWSQKNLRFIYLWASVALQLWFDIYLYHQKWIYGVTGDVFLLFPAKVLLHWLLICYCLMKNHFSEVKETSHSFTYEL